MNYMIYLCGKGCEECLVALALALNVDVIPGFQSMILFLILTKKYNFFHSDFYPVHHITEIYV